MSQPGLQVLDSRTILMCCDTLAANDTKFTSNAKAIRSQLQDVATTLCDYGDDAKFKQVRDGFIELLGIENEIQAHMAALEHLKDSYQPSLQQSKFKQVLKQQMDQELAASDFDPTSCPELRAFDEEATGQAAAAGGGDEDDDEIVMEGNAGVNTKCPITMKDVMELDDPVEDQKGYIYERAAVLQGIRLSSQRGQPYVCPAAGTNHIVREDELRPSRRVARERRRQMFQGTQAAAGGAGGTQRHRQAEEDVFDADAL